ncbi:Major Facilitator Superfamily protein [Halopenitus malekzadehii]|uniref:Major Facilitator Superfamily protein n=2 Tax=Halopenitus malekzadehii TaxID=1267564 RepID=A0A1H6HZM5_9EURY|nr:Major Facilitator Superfamily protein [Halopenitus malekzadehii]
MAGHGLVHVYELSIPILMTVWLAEFSVTAAVLGGVVTVGYGLFGVGALPGGLLADVFGSKRLIIGCLFGMGASFFALALAPGLVGIALALAGWGIAASVYHPAGLALISNGVDPDRRGAAFGYHGMAGNVGIAFGPLAAAVLLLVVDWRVVAAALGAISIVAGVIGLSADFDETAGIDAGSDAGAGADTGADADTRTDATAAEADGGSTDTNTNPDTGTKPEADTDTNPDTDIRSLRDFLAGSRRVFTAGFALVFLVVLCNGLVYRGMVTFLPELLREFLLAAVGDVRLGLFAPDSPLAEEFDVSRYVYVGLLTIGIAGQYTSGRLLDRIEPERGLAIVLFLLAAIAVAFVPLAAAGVGPLLAISAVLGFVLFGIQPFSQATVAAYSPPESRGLSFGFTYLGTFGIGALGATIVGVVLTYATADAAVFLVLAAVALVGCAIATLLRRGDLRP